MRYRLRSFVYIFKSWFRRETWKDCLCFEVQSILNVMNLNNLELLKI